MDNSVAISVEHVSKEFKVYFDKGTSLKEKVLFKSRRRHEVRTVLDDVSFQVKKGEAVGIIGRNGCGKSTMLKLLSKIMYPNGGRVVTGGRVSALIELGAGFHPDLSGLENVYTNASIFGLSRREIDRRLDAIIAFSELGEYVDNPVRTYSSGMYMRLAFSVAINVDADILLIDEILAVGDASFQAKCFKRLREIKANGTTIVIVSHALDQIEEFCDRSIWLCDGKIKVEGPPQEIHPAYLDSMAQKAAESSEPSAPTDEKQPESGEEKTRWGNGAATFTQIRLLDKEGKEKSAFVTGEPMTIEMRYQLNGEVENPVFGIGIFRGDGLQCYRTNTHIDRIRGLEIKQKGVVRFEIAENMLLPGDYILDTALHDVNGFAYDFYRYAKTFQMVGGASDVGVTRLPHRWIVDGAHLTA